MNFPFNFKLSGVGKVIRKGKKMPTMQDDDDPIEYGKSAMDDLVVKPSVGDEDTVQAVQAHIAEEIEKESEAENMAEPDLSPVPAVVLENDIVPPSAKPEFDPTRIQNALKDDELEGGVFKMRTTGLASMDSEQPRGAEYYKPQRELEAGAAHGKYEVSGFTVQYEPKPGGGLSSVQIRDYFDDLETAKASVSPSGYLIPLRSGYKLGRITLGCPVICLNERQILEYVNGNWRRG